CDRDQPLGGDAGAVETRPIGRAILGERKVLGDPQQVSSRDAGRNRTGASASRTFVGRESLPRRERQREAGGSGGFHFMRGGNFVQGAAAQATAENAVDGGDSEPKRSAAVGREAGGRFGRAEFTAEPIEDRRCPGGRTEGRSCGCAHGHPERKSSS